eukprot:PLAT16155.1.p1 GENE.PLAT16155.1~~PLAT16155.1.p1  ORF type:complete len:363 (+),score=92.40 PLAT16155.1:289-1377(+)
MGGKAGDLAHNRVMPQMRASLRLCAVMALATLVNGACTWKTVTYQGKPTYSACVDQGMSIVSRVFLGPVEGSRSEDAIWPRYTSKLCDKVLAAKRTDAIPTDSFATPGHDRGHLIADSMEPSNEMKQLTYRVMNMWCEPQYLNNAMHANLEGEIKKVKSAGAFWIGVAALAIDSNGHFVDITGNLQRSQDFSAPDFRFSNTIDCADAGAAAGFNDDCEQNTMNTLHHPMQRAYAWWMVLYYPQIDQSLCLFVFPYDSYTLVDCANVDDVVVVDDSHRNEAGDAFTGGVRTSVFNAAKQALAEATKRDQKLDFALRRQSQVVAATPGKGRSASGQQQQQQQQQEDGVGADESRWCLLLCGEEG